MDGCLHNCQSVSACAWAYLGEGLWVRTPEITVLLLYEPKNCMKRKPLTKAPKCSSGCFFVPVCLSVRLCFYMSRTGTSTLDNPSNNEGALLVTVMPSAHS